MRPPRHGRKAGMTLLEMMVSMVILLIAGGAALASLTTFSGLAESNEQTILAWNGLHRMVEEMYSNDFDRILALYDDDDANDPDGAGTAPGVNFAVDGLEAVRTDLDGFVGRIEFPQSGATPGQLFENHVDADFGMPRDLNGDGFVDGADHSMDYAVLPTRLTLRWKSRTGAREIELQVLLLR